MAKISIDIDIRTQEISFALPDFGLTNKQTVIEQNVWDRAIVDEIIEVPERADTRDTEAVKRICTAYLKLLFPNVRKPSDVNSREFNQYCLRPAVKMRGIIKTQLGILDTEFKGKGVPKFSIKEIPDEN